MKRVGIIGLGDMGIGLASNLLKSGFEVTGFDLSKDRLGAFEKLGGKSASNATAVAAASDSIFIMVLNGGQAKEVIYGQNGLIHELEPGNTVIVTGTFTPAEVRKMAAGLNDKGIEMIDTPVSGGKAGADGGTLTLMAAAPKEVLEDNRAVLEAVSAKLFHVGEEIGQGQTVKAALQAFIGTTFAAIFESLVLGASAGVSGSTLFEVFNSSGVRSPLFENCAKLILDRKFKGTGSHIGTMYKDLGITMQMAHETGAAMFTTAAAYELFQAGISTFPDEDNWSIVKFLEQIAGTKVEW
jgi:putative dehydrogenase